MSLTLWRLPQPARLIALPHVRGRLKLRGKPPGVALSLKERLQRLQGQPLPPVNIGFSHSVHVNRHEMAHLVRCCRADQTLERSARERTLRVPLDRVEAEWRQSQGVEHARSVAEHYGVFESLFGSGVFFTPVLPLRVEYPLEAEQADDEECSVVHVGNVIKPAEARRRPHVAFSAAEDSRWTLVCSNLEGPPDASAPELLHWMVTDIPGGGGGADAGRQRCQYLQPLPFRGTGYHRLAFVLYRQQGDVQAPPLADQHDLAARGFSTLEFYRRHEDTLTPAGLAFFQTDWDSSVMDYFHTQLRRKEPVFEYDWKPPYIRRQRWFPKAESVVHYVDRYADPRDLQKQMLLKRLSMVHPFEGVKEGPKYPLAIPKERGKRPPTWIINEQRKEARKISKYYYIDRRPETVFDPRV